MGKRSEDDEREIARWETLAGPRGRFMRFLVTLILKRCRALERREHQPEVSSSATTLGVYIDKERLG